MRCVSAQTPLAMSREQAWYKMQDLLLAKYYVPGVIDITITTEATGGVGASRRVYCKGRPPVDETVISWEDGAGFTVRLHKGDESPSPFSEAKFTYRLCDTEDGACLIQVELCYRLPDRWWSGVFDGLLMRHLVAHTVRSITRGMRQVYETGKSANPLVPE